MSLLTHIVDGSNYSIFDICSRDLNFHCFDISLYIHIVDGSNYSIFDISLRDLTFHCSEKSLLTHIVDGYNYSIFDISLRDLTFVVATYLCFAISLIDLVLCMCHRKLSYTLKNKWRIFIVRLVVKYIWISEICTTDYMKKSYSDYRLNLTKINQLTVLTRNQPTSRTNDFALWLIVKCKLYFFPPNVFTDESCFCKTLSSSDYHYYFMFLNTIY